MLAEVVSDMKSNMTFLAPLLAGIVLGLASMITAILSRLELLFQVGGDQAVEGFGNISSILNIFELSSMIPPYFLQIIIGLYLVQIVFILTRALVTIDSGEDKLERTNKTGKNLTSAIILYFITGFLAVIMLFVLTSIVVGGLI